MITFQSQTKLGNLTQIMMFLNQIFSYHSGEYLHVVYWITQKTLRSSVSGYLLYPWIFMDVIMLEKSILHHTYAGYITWDLSLPLSTICPTTSSPTLSNSLFGRSLNVVLIPHKAFNYILYQNQYPTFACLLNLHRYMCIFSHHSWSLPSSCISVYATFP